MTNASTANPASSGHNFWSSVKACGQWLWKKLLAPGVALVVAVIGIVLLSMGAKNLQIGGVLQKLLSGWKKNPDPSAPKPIVANQIPVGRVDASGKLIPEGIPDAQGVSQAVVVPIQGTGGLFSNPNTVTIQPPGNKDPIQVPLPTGIKAKDVDKVVVVQPGQFVVTVKDTSGISAGTIDDVLKKYGG